MTEHQARLSSGKPARTPTCHQCGQDIPPRSRYCLWCGQRPGWRPGAWHAAVAAMLIAIVVLPFVPYLTGRYPHGGGSAPAHAEEAEAGIRTLRSTDHVPCPRCGGSGILDYVMTGMRGQTRLPVQCTRCYGRGWLYFDETLEGSNHYEPHR